MTDNTQPEAMDLADWLEAVGGGPSAKRCAALLREQHARIAELESELEAVGAGGVQALSAAPAGWKLVPVNPTPEMWKAAKSVPDPNPPYPPHYGLVWDAMLAASPTPTAEQQAAPKAAPAQQAGEAAESVPAVEREQERIAFKDAHRHLELYEVPDAWGRPMFKYSHVEASWLGWIARASRGQASPKAVPGEQNDACAILAKVCDLFQIGALARTESTILSNVENTLRFSNMLGAVERDLFPQPDLPEDDDPYAEVDDNLPTPNRWGAEDEADYVSQFKAALLARGFAAPQQEPAFWTRQRFGEEREFCEAPFTTDWTPLYTAPQPAPAPLSDDVVKDAARWRMAALIGNELMLHPDKRTHATAVKAYMDATHSGSDLTGAVDAAIVAQGGKA